MSGFLFKVFRKMSLMHLRQHLRKLEISFNHPQFTNITLLIHITGRNVPNKTHLKDQDN